MNLLHYRHMAIVDILFSHPTNFEMEHMVLFQLGTGCIRCCTSKKVRDNVFNVLRKYFKKAPHTLLTQAIY